MGSLRIEVDDAETQYTRPCSGGSSASARNSKSMLWAVAPPGCVAENRESPVDPGSRATAASPKRFSRLPLSSGCVRIDEAAADPKRGSATDGCSSPMFLSPLGCRTPCSGAPVLLYPLSPNGMSDETSYAAADRKRAVTFAPADSQAWGTESAMAGAGSDTTARRGLGMRRSFSNPRLEAIRSDMALPLPRSAGSGFLQGASSPMRSPVQQLRRNMSESLLGKEHPQCPPDPGTEPPTQEESAPSILQRRRRLKPLAVDTLKEPLNGLTSLAGAMLAAMTRKDIRYLADDEKIFDLYHWDEVLQEQGDGGKVVVCKPKSAANRFSTKSYVMKIRSKESLQKVCHGVEEQFRRVHTRMLNLPPHDGVVPVHEVLEDDRFYYVVMAKASGGAFFPALLKEFGDGVMPATAVRRVLKDILEAVGYVHNQGMLHRDLKPDNLVMQVSRVCLIDFDHADPDWDPSAKAWQSIFCGTVRFSAPEAFLGFYSQASDLYSVGVILYLLLAGRMPYNDSLYEEEFERKRQAGEKSKYDWRAAVYERMKEARIDWEFEPWTSQPLCREFCRQLLSFDAGERPRSAEEALTHAWFRSD